MSWEEVPIGELCQLKHGYAFKSKYFEFEGEYILLSPGNFFEWGGLKLKGDKEKYFVGEIPSDYVLEENDLLVVLTDLIQSAPILGGAAFIPESNKFLHNQRLGKVMNLDKSRINEKYFYYCLNDESYRVQIRATATGATVRHTAPERVYNAKISLPPLPTQKKIADILSAYDDLIENNLKRIKLLEEAAQNIYKEWFVNFRFPNHENTPIDDETGLPVWWENTFIGEFGTVVTGKTPSTKKVNYYGGDIPFVKTPDMHKSSFIVESEMTLTKEGAESQIKKTLPPYSVMVSCIGTAGVVAMNYKECQTNQQINSVVFEGNNKNFYFYCYAKTLKQLLEGLGSNGATMVNVNKGKFEGIEMVSPSEELLTEFDRIVKPMFMQIIALLETNFKLKEARDILLPRLMNRTIEV